VTPETHRQSAAPPLRPTYPVIIAMLMVVVSFAASLGYTHLRMRSLDERALEIIRDSVPGIQHLSGARTELVRMAMYVSECVSGTCDSHAFRRTTFDTIRQKFDAELQAYSGLPDSREESRLLPELGEQLGLLGDASERILDAVDAGDSAAAKQVLQGSFNPRLVQSEALIAQLQSLNEIDAKASADRILVMRRTTANTAGLLGIASLIIALIASVLVLRVLKGRARLLHEHAQLLADRSAELEAFAGRVAHDLKDPLNAITLRVIAAQRGGDLGPKTRDHIDKIKRQLERMNQTIEGLLEFARAGAIAAPGANADLEKTLHEVITDLRPAADAVNADLQLGASPALRLACTPAALSSVISNLLANAVKYIGEGTQFPRRITVQVTERTDVARIEVVDNGPGLPPGTEQRIFEPFFRLHERTQPGVGLGLATVKKIVEAYRGRCGVHSVHHRGSTFWFEIPKVHEEPQPRGSQARGTASQGFTR
jgi:signal transduction histidine kinase